ncbi:MAG TPA: flagellar motor switch protein FliG [Gemmatimonadales bacterium]|jgi:flagellar motor switch protein FliG
MTAVAPRKAGSSALSGPQKAAVLVMALGADASAKILARLAPDEVEAITRTIARTPMAQPDMVDAVLGEFRDAARTLSAMTPGGEDYAREVLESAMGVQRARGVMDRIREAPSATPASPLSKAAPDVLQLALRGEQPQTLALVLAHLEPKVAAQMITGMDPELSADVLYRVATMERVAPEVLHMVEKAILARSETSAPPEMIETGGPATVARLLNQLSGGADTSLLAAVGSRGTEVADAIRNLMFVFEDLLLLGDRSMQRLLRDVDSRELAIGLKAASEELKAHVLKNMSERAGAALREELEMLGSVKVKDVQAAHTSIIATVRALQDAEEITIERGGDEDVIG